MKVKNNSKRCYCHVVMNESYQPDMLLLKPNEVKDIPDEVAKGWLKSGEVVEYVAPADAKKLEAEIAKLKAENEQLKKDNDELPDREVLKKQADELGIEYAKNISTKALYDKVKDAQFTSNEE